MALFHKMILNTLAKKLGADAQAFANEVCAQMGVSFESLRPNHMPRFSALVRTQAEPTLGEGGAKTLSGIISHFEKSRL